MSWQDNVARFPRAWIWDLHPVFHIAREEIATVDGVSMVKTRCGITLTAWSNETGDMIVDRDVSIRRTHAEKFARPCRRCVPAGEENER